MDRFSTKSRPVKNYQGTDSRGALAYLESGRSKELNRPTWNYCRDLFHNQTEGYKGYILFCVSKRQAASFEQMERMKLILATFFDHYEDVLKIENKSFYGCCVDPHVMWIKPSLFWYWSPMRRSFMTMLLRAGFEHAENTVKNNQNLTFQQSLENNNYCKSTIVATNSFLSGKTVWSKRKNVFSGWVACFNQANQAKVDSLIRAPKEEVNEEIVVQEEKIVAPLTENH